MRLRDYRSRAVRRGVVIASAIGIVHFVLSLRLWWSVLRIGLDSTGPVRWGGYAYGIPAVVLLVVFIAAFGFALNRKRVSAVLLLLGTILSAACFILDTRGFHYQIQALTIDRGCEHLYCTWWWYDDDGER